MRGIVERIFTKEDIDERDRATSRGNGPTNM